MQKGPNLNKIEEVLKGKIILSDGVGNSVELNEHQIGPADTLIKKCSNQKGILLWHTMGSGKTITALNIAMNLPIHDSDGKEHKRIILGPKGIEISWLDDSQNVLNIIGDKKQFYNKLVVKTTKDNNPPPNSIRNLGTTHPDVHPDINKVSYNNPIYYSYSDIQDISTELLNNLDNSILICDEAHNLVKTLRNLLKSPFSSDNIKAKTFIASLDKVFKIVLLTGTPLTADDFSEIAPLINIVAGTNVLPSTAESITDMLRDDESKPLEIKIKNLTNKIEKIEQTRKEIEIMKRKEEKKALKWKNKNMLIKGAYYLGVGSYRLLKQFLILCTNIPGLFKRFYNLIIKGKYTIMAAVLIAISLTFSIYPLGIIGVFTAVHGIAKKETIIDITPLLMNISNRLKKKDPTWLNYMGNNSNDGLEELKIRKGAYELQLQNFEQNISNRDDIIEKFSKIISPYVSFYDYKINGKYIDLWQFPFSQMEPKSNSIDIYKLSNVNKDVFISNKELMVMESKLEEYKKRKTILFSGLGGMTIMGTVAGALLTVPPLMGLAIPLSLTWGLALSVGVGGVGAGVISKTVNVEAIEQLVRGNNSKLLEISENIENFRNYKGNVEKLIVNIKGQTEKVTGNLSHKINNFFKDYNRVRIPWEQYQLYVFYKKISKSIMKNIKKDLTLTFNEASLLDKIGILADNIGVDKTGISSGIRDKGNDKDFVRLLGNISYDMEYFGTLKSFPSKSGNQVFIPIPNIIALNNLSYQCKEFQKKFTNLRANLDRRQTHVEFYINDVQKKNLAFKGKSIELNNAYLYEKKIRLSIADVDTLLKIIGNDIRRLNKFKDQISIDLSINEKTPIKTYAEISNFSHICPFYLNKRNGQMLHRKKLLIWIREYKNIILRVNVQCYCIPKSDGLFGKNFSEDKPNAISIYQKSLLKTINNINTYKIFNNFKLTSLINKLTNSNLSPDVNICREDNFYLPVVYSNFEKHGFNLISAYLTYRGFNHIAMHNDSKIEVKENLSRISKLPFKTLKHRFVRYSELLDNSKANESNKQKLERKYINMYQGDVGEFFDCKNKSNCIERELDNGFDKIIPFTNSIKCIAAESIEENIVFKILKNIRKQRSKSRKSSAKSGATSTTRNTKGSSGTRLLEVITNSGVPRESAQNTWSNQCFWISLSDWLKIKNPDDNNSVEELKRFAQGLTLDSGNQPIINNNNSQIILDSQGPNSSHETINKLAQEKGIYIRVFSYDEKNKNLMTGECRQTSPDVKDSWGCLGRYRDYGSTSDANNSVMIVSYGLNHFQLITKYRSGDLEYDLGTIDNPTTSVTYGKYYDNNGVLKQLNKLTKANRKIIFDVYTKSEKFIDKDGVEKKYTDLDPSMKQSIVKQFNITDNSCDDQIRPLENIINEQSDRISKLESQLDIDSPTIISDKSDEKNTGSHKFKDVDEVKFMEAAIYKIEDVYFEIYEDDPNLDDNIMNKLGLNRLRAKFVNNRTFETIIDYEYWDQNEGVVKSKLNLIDNSEFYHNTPICVLLHNKLTEGIDLPMSPSIHVLEMPDNYGKAGQIYARILRNIRSSKPYNFSETINNYIGITNSSGSLIEKINSLVEMLNNINDPLHAKLRELKLTEGDDDFLKKSQNLLNILIDQKLLDKYVKARMKIKKKSVKELVGKEIAINNICILLTNIMSIINKILKFYYKAIKTNEQCNGISINNEQYNKTVKFYELKQHCCEPYIKKDSKNINYRLKDSKKVYLDKICKIYLNGTNCTPIDPESSKVNEYKGLQVDPIFKKISIKDDEIKKVLFENLDKMTYNDEIIFNISLYNSNLELSFKKEHLIALLTSDDDILRLNMPKITYNPNNSPIKRCFKKIYQYSLSYNENKLYLMSEYDLEARKQIAMFINNTNKSGKGNRALNKEDIQILNAYLHKKYKDCQFNKILTTSEKMPDVDNLDKEAEKINKVVSGYWIFSSSIMGIMKAKYYNLKNYLLKLKIKTRDIFTLNPEYKRYVAQYSEIFELSDKFDDGIHIKDVNKLAKIDTTLVFNFSRASININVDLKYAPEYLEILHLTNKIKESKLDLIKYLDDESVFKGVLTKKLSRQIEELSDFMIFIEKILEKYGNTYKRRCKCSLIKDGLIQFKNGILQKIPSISFRPAFDDKKLDFNMRKQEFLNGGKLFKKNHFEIRNYVIKDIILNNENISVKQWLQYLNIKNVNFNKLNDNEQHEILVEAFNEKFNEVSLEKNEIGENILNYLNSETELEKKIIKQKLFFKKMQNYLVKSENNECGEGNVSPLDLSKEPIQIYFYESAQLDNPSINDIILVIKFSITPENIHNLVLGDQISLNNLSNDGLHYLNTNEEENLNTYFVHSKYNESKKEIEFKCVDLTQEATSLKDKIISSRTPVIENYKLVDSDKMGNNDLIKQLYENCTIPNPIDIYSSDALNDNRYDLTLYSKNHSFESINVELDNFLSGGHDVSYINILYKFLILMKYRIKYQYLNDFLKDFKVMGKLKIAYEDKGVVGRIASFLNPWSKSINQILQKREGCFKLIKHFDLYINQVEERLLNISAEEKHILLFIENCISNIIPYEMTNDEGTGTSGVHKNWDEIPENMTIFKSLRKRQRLFKNLNQLLIKVTELSKSLSLTLGQCDRDDDVSPSPTPESSTLGRLVDDMVGDEVPTDCSSPFDCINIDKFEKDTKYQRELIEDYLELCSNDQGTVDSFKDLYDELNTGIRVSKETGDAKKLDLDANVLPQTISKKNNFNNYVKIIDKFKNYLEKYTKQFEINTFRECKYWKLGVDNIDSIKQFTPTGEKKLCIKPINLRGGSNEKTDNFNLKKIIKEHLIELEIDDIDAERQNFRKNLKKYIVFDDDNFNSIFDDVKTELISNVSDSKVKNILGLINGEKIYVKFYKNIFIKSNNLDKLNLIPKEHSTINFNPYFWLLGKSAFNIHNRAIDKSEKESIDTLNIQLIRSFIINSDKVIDRKQLKAGVAKFESYKNKIMEYIYYLNTGEFKSSSNMNDEQKKYIIEKWLSVDYEKPICMLSTSLGLFIDKLSKPYYTIKYTIDDFDFNSQFPLFRNKQIKILNLYPNIKHTFSFYHNVLNTNTDEQEVTKLLFGLNLKYQFNSNNNYLSNNPFLISEYDMIPTYKSVTYPDNIYAFKDKSNNIKFQLGDIKFQTPILQLLIIGKTIFNTELNDTFYPECLSTEFEILTEPNVYQKHICINNTEVIE